MNLALTLCYVALSAAVDVKLHIDITSMTTDFFECQMHGNVQDITCKSQDQDSSDSSVGQVPATYFSAIIDCTAFRPVLYDSLRMQPWEICAKMTVTQNMETDSQENVGYVEMKAGTVTNITCVFFFRPNMKFHMMFAGYIKDKSATGGGYGETIELVKYRSEDEAKVDSDTCLKTVEDSFEWSLSLVKSSRNVHELLWNSQAKQPDYDRLEANLAEMKMNLPVTLQDVAFKDLDPKISQAAVRGTSGNFAKLVTLKTFEAAFDQPKKHEEKLELSVDATQLPKGTKELEVTVEYTIPNVATKRTKLKLPVDSPQIDDKPAKGGDDKPAKGGDDKPAKGGGAGLTIFLVVFPAGLVVVLAAFCYRRHQRIQAHAREV